MQPGPRRWGRWHSKAGGGGQGEGKKASTPSLGCSSLQPRLEPHWGSAERLGPSAACAVPRLPVRSLSLELRLSVALSPCPSRCGALSISCSRPGLAVRTPLGSWPGAPSSGYLSELLRPSDTASSRLAPAGSYGRSPKEGPGKEGRPSALGTQCLGSGCVWGERICTPREPERSSKGKPESQAHSDRGINPLRGG